MSVLLILFSFTIYILCYLIISKGEKSYINFMTPMFLISVPTMFVLEGIYINFYGYSNSDYAYFWIYITYIMKMVIFVLTFCCLKRKREIINEESSYKIKSSPYIFMLIGIIIYLPIVLQFPEVFIAPRVVYMQTRLGYGMFTILSTTFFLLGFILALYKQKKINYKIWILALLAIFFLYLHASKLQYVTLFFIIIFFRVYIMMIKVKFIGFIKILSMLAVSIVLMFYMSFSSYIDDIDTEMLLKNIAAYSDYNRNAMMVVDELKEPFYGRIIFEDNLFSKVPRNVFPDKPKDFGARKLTKIFYPDWYYSEAGDPIFGDGVAFADFKELSFGYFFIMSVFLAIAYLIVFKYLYTKYSIAAFVVLLYLSGVPIITAGNGSFLLETIVLGLLINRIVLLLAAFVLALPQTFAKNCSPVLPHSGLKFGTLRDAKL